MSKKHKVWVIGWIGSKTCYVDMPLEEAKRRFNAQEGYEVSFDDIVDSFEFNDSFAAYDAWSSYDDTPTEAA